MDGENKKNKLKRGVCIVLTLVMTFTFIPSKKMIVNAASYNASSAVSFANSHWNDGVGLCAEFVSRCLSAGGISIPNSAYYSTSQQSYQNNSGTLGSYRNPYTCSAALLLYLSQNYPIITNPSSSQISVGDVVFMYGGSSGQWKDGHVGIIISTSGGVPVYAAHNKATNTGKFSSSYPCTYVAKMNGTIATHKVNSSYGTNFTAYPKSKITAENIFDENHNMISSTAWIGTNDKCTIYEVYTDGCCKLSYPIDSGGSRTVYSKISLFNTHTHSYTGTRVHEAEHPHAITQRCTDYASCGGYKVTGEYAQVKTCKQCWYTSFDFSASSVSLKVGESKTISATINGFWPDTMVGVFDYDTSRIEVTTGQNTITFKGLKVGTCTLKLIIYSDSTKSYIIGSKSISVTVSDPTYTGRVSFDKSSISLVMPTNKTSTLTIELTGTWPEGAGYTFDYNSNVVSMSQNGTVLTITAKNAGSTNFTINIVNKNNNNALITSAVCPITVENAKYTIKYNANGGSGEPEIQTKYYNTTLKLSSVKPTRSGYTFLGWSTSSSATSASYQPGGGFTSNSNTTLYAVWKKGCESDSHSYSYKVTTTPTTSSTGILTGTCLNCSSTTTVSLPKLSTPNYSYRITKAATCTTTGTGRYIWETTTYGSFYFDVTIAITSHTYGSWIYKDSEYHIHNCSNCEAWEKSNHTWGGPKYVESLNQNKYVCGGCGAEKYVSITESIEIVALPNKIAYEIGDAFDSTGLQVRAKFAGGSSAIISGYSLSGFDSSSAGTKTVTVKYDGLTTTFTVTVNEPDINENAPQIVLDSKKVTVGKEFAVAVELKNNPGFNAASIKIEYDNNKLQLINAELSEAFSTGANVSYDNLPYLTFIRSNDVSDDAEFLILSFKALDVGDVKLSIGYEEGDISNSKEEDVNFIVVGGDISIAQYTPGDINDDGKVNTKDLTRLLKYINHEDVEYNEQVLDVNGDGKVNTKDLTRLLRYINRENVEIF